MIVIGMTFNYKRVIFFGQYQDIIYQQVYLQLFTMICLLK